MNIDKSFELTFFDTAWLRESGRMPRYRQSHETIESARKEALRVLPKLPHRDATPAMIYGPNSSDPIVVT
jgi:hypothetical protein